MPVSGSRSHEAIALENDIAVIGMGARLPDAHTVSEFWRNLASGHCSVRDLTEEQLLAAGEKAQRADNFSAQLKWVLDAEAELDT